MAAYYEQIVKMPGIVEIRRIPDDPNAEPEDLFEKQREGSPAW